MSQNRLKRTKCQQICLTYILKDKFVLAYPQMKFDAFKRVGKTWILSLVRS
jgi:hypothetical protein